MQSQQSETQEQDVFTSIHKNNSWKGSESSSGSGSSVKVTQLLRDQLPTIFNDLSIKILVDAPCGDFNWFVEMQHDLDLYIGIDIVPELITENNSKDLGLRFLFKHGNILSDILPRADAIFCRDCLVHMPFESIFRCLQNFKKSNSRFLMMTTFPEKNSQRDSAMGGWRPLNFQIPPFNFGDPICIIRERMNNPSDPYNDKSIGVWEIKQIKF